MPRGFHADGERFMSFLTGAFPRLRQVLDQVQEHHPFFFEHPFVEAELLGAGDRGNAVIRHQSQRSIKKLWLFMSCIIYTDIIKFEFAKLSTQTLGSIGIQAAPTPLSLFTQQSNQQQ